MNEQNYIEEYKQEKSIKIKELKNLLYDKIVYFF